MRERQRRTIAVVLVALVAIASTLFADFNKARDPVEQPPKDTTVNSEQVAGSNTELARSALNKLAVKGRAPRTGYEREQFGAGWAEVESCDMRNFILQRDLENEVFAEASCIVLSGTLNDPYTAKVIQFQRGETTSDDVQIDHVVALSDAWQKGAQQMDIALRAEFANDPLNLLAVDGPTNNEKSFFKALALILELEISRGKDNEVILKRSHSY